MISFEECVVINFCFLLLIVDLSHQLIFQLKGKEKQVKAEAYAQNILEVKGSMNPSPLNPNDGSPLQVQSELEDVMADIDWEDGSNPNLNSESNHPDYMNQDITIEFDSSPGTAKRKPIRRASAEEKVNIQIFRSIT